MSLHDRPGQFIFMFGNSLRCWQHLKHSQGKMDVQMTWTSQLWLLPPLLCFVCVNCSTNREALRSVAWQVHFWRLWNIYFKGNTQFLPLRSFNAPWPILSIFQKKKKKSNFGVWTIMIWMIVNTLRGTDTELGSNPFSTFTCCEVLSNLISLSSSFLLWKGTVIITDVQGACWDMY